MIETPGSPEETARPTKPDEYEDRHYHDDDEIVPADDGPHRSARLPSGTPSAARRRRIPPPRRRPDDD